MKKILSVLMMTVLTVGMLQAREVVTQDTQKLPAEARQFITQHFPETKISYIKIDSELFQGKKYEVVLTSGTELEFDSKGQWKEVDCKRNIVPIAIIPEQIRNYVQTNFSKNTITQIDRDKYGYDVELDNDLSVEFDKNGNFRRLDD